MLYADQGDYHNAVYHTYRKFPVIHWHALRDTSLPFCMRHRSSMSRTSDPWRFDLIRLVPDSSTSLAMRWRHQNPCNSRMMRRMVIRFPWRIGKDNLLLVSSPVLTDRRAVLGNHHPAKSTGVSSGRKDVSTIVTAKQKSMKSFATIALCRYWTFTCDAMQQGDQSRSYPLYIL